jgi:hypothetical protein
MAGRGWVAASVLAGVGMAVALLRPPVALPSDRLGIRWFQVPIEPGMTVAQRFAMTADGLHGIEISAAALGKVSGRLRLDLHEEGSGVVRSMDVPADRLVALPSFRFAFEPIEDSKDAIYRIEITSPESDPPTGVALLATKGRRAAGTLLINARERWGGLAFTTLAPGAKSAWQRLWEWRADSAAGLATGHLVLAAFALYWLVLALLMRSLWPAG